MCKPSRKSNKEGKFSRPLLVSANTNIHDETQPSASISTGTGHGLLQVIPICAGEDVGCNTGNADGSNVPVE